jgi:hypothetical protein
MAFAPKPKIKMICLGCSKEVALQPWRIVKFRFCSNDCKWKAKKKKIPHNKMGNNKKTWIKCRNFFCNLGKLQKPHQIKAKKFKFCSCKCYQYYRSAQYNLDLENLKTKQQVEMKTKNIWLFSR